MKSNVLITIVGKQSDGVQQDSIETIQGGHYRHVGDCDVISYEEMLLDEQTEHTVSTRNLLKIQPDFVSLTKRGLLHTKMDFAVGQPFHGFYQTPYGVFDMVIQTKKITLQKEEDKMKLYIQYRLELNGEFISDSELDIRIESC